jgi:iron(III) transport system ATP-binding protein
MADLRIAELTKSFGGAPILRGIDLVVQSGALVAILGASGSGKTTLLRLIAGFERLDGGRLRIGERTVDDGHRTVAAQHRHAGCVPQDGSLFPHLTAIGNIRFGLSRRNRGNADRLLELTGMADLRGRYPHQLSGGQQQRVALARALAPDPDVLLLDEPFSSLDASLRAELRRDVARILGETGTTAILVTHDQDEALGLADQIAVLSAGRILAAADPRDLYRHPPDPASAIAIGDGNILAAEVCAGIAICSLGSVPVGSNGATPADGPSSLLLRPEQLLVHVRPRAGATRAVVQALEYQGHDALARLHPEVPGGGPVIARIPGELEVTVGEPVWVEIVGPGRAWPHGR